MDRKSFIKIFLRSFLVGIALSFIFAAYQTNSGYGNFLGKKKIEKTPKDYLMKIHHEVKELGSYPNEAFIKREFHTELDGDTENKEEHVVVLIYRVGEKERMLVQVTYFASKRKNSPVKYPKEIRVILCNLSGDDLEISHSDYDEKEIESLLPDILQGIRKKKEILKLLEEKK